VARVKLGLRPFDEPLPIEDFGFMFPVEQVKEWFLHLDRYGHYPEPGALSQQDPRKMRDIYMMQALVNEEFRHEQDLLKSK
jgi:hypothetical protein